MLPRLKNEKSIRNATHIKAVIICHVRNKVPLPFTGSPLYKSRKEKKFDGGFLA